ncbi:Hypothetical protein GLP15_2238 [Giardia lamblia P15]|uniref:Uncharacterized protein n=1 Tax=Giardia intestinalis (strain P15) TaxID=658858 RepID=E1F750_GIAIA|nr:Hypothetical protein GLP15_2238 [Giardia lamblia P15]
MATNHDYSALSAEEQGFLTQVLSVFPNDGVSRTIIRRICAVFISKLQASEKVYESHASDLANQIKSLRALIGTEPGRSSTELSSLLMLLIQLRRLAYDHLLQVKAEVSEAIKQADADLKSLKSQLVDSSSLAKLGDEILCKAPIANCMARSAAFDAVTAITSHVSHCVVLAFALHKFSVSIKERSLKFLAEDDQDSATLVLIERQNVLTTIKTLVEHCSVLTKAANWFAREAEKDLLLTICANDLRVPCIERTAADIEADCEKSKRLKSCCEIFVACLDSNSPVQDADKDKNYSFTELSTLVATDSGYEALIKKVSRLNAELREKRALLSESMVAANVEESTTLTSDIARQKEKIANLVSFGHDLHAELYTLPHGLEALINRLSVGLLTLRSVLLGLQDEDFQADVISGKTEECSSSFLKLAECYAKTDNDRQPASI